MTVCAKIAVLRITLLFASGGIFSIVKSKKNVRKKLLDCTEACGRGVDFYGIKRPDFCLDTPPRQHLTF